jgi:hypothetical protein
MWTNQFVPFQALPTFGVRDFDFVHDEPSGSFLLASASSKETSSGPYEVPSFVFDTLGLRVPLLEEAQLSMHNTNSMPWCSA